MLSDDTRRALEANLLRLNIPTHLHQAIAECLDAPWYVTCARCGQDYPENDDNVYYDGGDWWCRYEQDCDGRMAALEERNSND